MKLDNYQLNEGVDFKNGKEALELYLRSYECGATYLAGGYLFPHQRETPADYKYRKKRAVPPGFAKAVINTYKSLISRTKPSRTWSGDEFGEFLEDVDKRGTNISNFMLENAFPISQATGMTWILVDQPVVPDLTDSTGETRKLTEADRIALGIRPYLIEYDGTQIINWQFDGFGKLEWVTVRTGIKKNTTYKVWDRWDWTTYDADGTKIDTGFHNLGEVPFVILYNDRSVFDRNIGLSAISNIAYLNREIFNLVSLLQEFMYKQCFNFLALDKSLLTEEGIAVLGSSNAIPVPPGGFAPMYVSPPSAPAQFLMDQIKDDINRIYQEAGLVDQSAQQVAQAQSGIARAFVFHNTNTLLGKKARNLEEAEMGIAHLYELYTGQNVKYTVDYADNFDIKDATAELDEVVKFLSLRINSSELKRFRAKQMVDRLMPQLTEEQRDAVDKQIDVDGFGLATAGSGLGILSGLANV